MSKLPKKAIQAGMGLVFLVATLATASVLYSHADSSSQVKSPQAQESSIERRPLSDAPAAPTTSPVQLAAPARSPAFVAKAVGTLMSANQATLSFQATGRIKEIKVKEGDRVKAGDVIATLETAALDAQVLQAQAALESAVANLAKVKAGPSVEDLIIAKSNVDRARATYEQAQSAYDPVAANAKIAMMPQAFALQSAESAYQAAVAQYNLTAHHPTELELKVAQASVAQAQATLESAKLSVANARITAPFDGTVLWVGSKVGESAVSGSAAVTIADLPRMQVQVNVDEGSVGAIQVGQTATIAADALRGKTLTGHVAKVGMMATTSGNIVLVPITVEIDPTDALIYPGLSATVEVQGQMQ